MPIVAVLLAACTAAIPRPTERDSARAGKPLDVLTQGRSLLLNKCGNCHLVPEPSSRTIFSWQSLVADMGRDAELSEAQTADLLAFLEAFASNARPDADGQRGQGDHQ